jgi:hypothetical protein
MYIRSLIIAACLSSSSLYADIINPYFSIDWSAKGQIATQGSGDYGYGAETGTIWEIYDSFTTGEIEGVDGFRLEVTGNTAVEDWGDKVILNFSGGYGWSGGTFRTEYTVSYDMDFTLYEDAFISFDLSSFTLGNGFTGSAYVQVDGTTVSDGVLAPISAGAHTVYVYITGTNPSPGGSMWEYSHSFSAIGEITTIPEPGTWALMLGGIAAAWGVKRRRA